MSARPPIALASPDLRFHVGLEQPSLSGRLITSPRVQLHGMIVALWTMAGRFRATHKAIIGTEQLPHVMPQVSTRGTTRARRASAKAREWPICQRLTQRAAIPPDARPQVLREAAPADERQ